MSRGNRRVLDLFETDDNFADKMSGVKMHGNAKINQNSRFGISNTNSAPMFVVVF